MSDLVTRDPATGLRRNPIRHPDGQPPTPFGCRWCGTEQGGHGSRWVASRGMHRWERPTSVQMLARMKTRRALAVARAVNAATHTTTATEETQ
jgi:hypothetical protein